MKNPPYIGYVVSHTHWDRAWYNTFQQFRIVLIDRVQRLLDLLESSPDFKCFVFDGQMSPFEDYLEVHPEDRERIAAQVKSGRLVVGPWYVLPDLFLVSGESLVRNLLIGMREAGRLGRSMRVGYIPDPFGHVSQIPQILSGFGLDSMIFARGLGEEADKLGIEFNWQSPCPGKSVMAVQMVESYVNLMAWGVPLGEPVDTFQADINAAKQRITELVDKMEQFGPTTKRLLFNNGVDHDPAQPIVPTLIREINSKQSRVKLQHGSFEDYIRAIQKDKPRLKKHQGELHSGKYHYILSGVFSARMPLKQANTACQNLLESTTEPLAVWAWLLGRDYPGGIIDYAWRTLLKNHPHDDICGCSIDEVHRDMIPRFDAVAEVGERVAQRSLVDMAGKPGEGLSLMVYNPSPQTADVPFAISQRGVYTSIPLGKRWVFMDEEGAVVSASIKIANERTGMRRRDGQEKPIWIYDIDAEGLAPTVPGLGISRLRLEPGKATIPAEELKCGNNWISNGRIKLTAASDGKLTLHDLQNGNTVGGLHYFEDEADAGDEYDFSPLAKGHKVCSSVGVKAKIKTLVSKAGCARMQISWALRLPKSLSKNRATRSTNITKVKITSEVSLYPGSERVAFDTTIDNTVQDHRLRVVFPTGVASDHSIGDSAFDLVKRPIELPAAKDWSQPPQPTHASQSRVLVENDKSGFALFHKGLPEYEARKSNGGLQLCLTLLRCVGFLSRNDMVSRDGHAGPFYATPEAQCLGQHRFQYAIRLYDGVSNQSEAVADGRAFTLGSEAFFTTADGGNALPPSLLEVQDEGIELACLKKAQERDSVIARFWNTTAKSAALRLLPSFACKRAFLTDLSEKRQIEIKKGRDGFLKTRLKPFEIITIELEPDLAAPFGFKRETVTHGDVTRLP
jgi:2-O-(6-phospho-alpha-D-mannosyl)-D-glycerate hydrolase